MRKLTVIVLSAIAIGAAAPAAADDNRPSDREYRQHQRLEQQHHREDHRLERQHDAAHYYGISRKQDRRLHQRLQRQERQLHHRLEERHDRQHDRRW